MSKPKYRKLASIYRQVNEGYNRFAEKHGWPKPKPTGAFKNRKGKK